MAKLLRFGVSLEAELLRKFDGLVRKRGYASRSDAFRDLIRHELVEEQWQAGGEIAGAITIVYDHHRRELVNTLLTVQHDFGDLIIASQHVHLDHHSCLEIIAIKGTPAEARKLADGLRSIKGVKHGTLSMSTTGKSI
jgi:CopG family transcriptional regulator, nickel-responsive regulator